MSEELTKEDVHQILFAIDVAQGEIGEEGFQELRAKLYRLYPEVKAEQDFRERQLQAESDRQTQLRKEIVEEFLRHLEANTSPIYKNDRTILEQLKKWFVKNYKEVRNHCSDEICFAFDLWKYADEKLVAKIANECRLELIKGSDFDKCYAGKSDEETVHGLIHILENVERNARMKR